MIGRPAVTCPLDIVDFVWAVSARGGDGPGTCRLALRRARSGAGRAINLLIVTRLFTLPRIRNKGAYLIGT